MKKLTTEQFIEKAKSVHNNKYNYSKSIYTGRHNKLIITCPIHGDFVQEAGSHLLGNGCPKCGREGTIEHQRKSFNQFIKDCRKIHGDKYDYSKVDYRGAKTKVCIIYPIHGEFWQTPDDHINGKHDCPKCVHKNDKYTLQEFINNAKQVHGNKYDYSKVNYINNITKVEIICPEHGSFWQIPTNHILKKCGCPYCKESKGEKIVYNILKNYILILLENMKYLFQHLLDLVEKVIQIFIFQILKFLQNIMDNNTISQLIFLEEKFS